MRVQVKFFAAARAIVGQGEVSVDLREGSTVGDLMEHCFTKYPKLKEIEGSLLLSVNQEFSERNAGLENGDEIGIMPPVSGGRDV